MTGHEAWLGRRHDGKRARRVVAFGSDRPEPRCFVRRLRVAHDPADDTVAIAHVEIVITAAAVLVGADKDERSGGSHVTRAVGGRNLRIYALAMLPTGPTSKPTTFWQD